MQKNAIGNMVVSSDELVQFIVALASIITNNYNMNNSYLGIKEICREDTHLVISYVTARWGSPMSVSKGRILNTADLPKFIYKNGRKLKPKIHKFGDDGISVKHEIEIELRLQHRTNHLENETI